MMFNIIIKLFFLFSFIFTVQVQSKDSCIRYFSIGNEQFCIPKYELLSECRFEDRLKFIFSSYKIPQHKIVAFYIDKTDWDNFKSTDKIVKEFDKKIIVMNSEMFSDKTISYKDFYDIYKLTIQNYTKNNDLANKFLKDQNLDIINDVPLIIEESEIINKSKSAIIIQNVKLEDVDYVNLFCFNSLLIRGKIITILYHIPYTDKNSIIQLRTKNDYFIRKFIQLNEK